MDGRAWAAHRRAGARLQAGVGGASRPYARCRTDLAATFGQPGSLIRRCAWRGSTYLTAGDRYSAIVVDPPGTHCRFRCGRRGHGVCGRSDCIPRRVSPCSARTNQRYRCGPRRRAAARGAIESLLPRALLEQVSASGKADVPVPYPDIKLPVREGEQLDVWENEGGAAPPVSSTGVFHTAVEQARCHREPKLCRPKWVPGRLCHSGDPVDPRIGSTDTRCARPSIRCHTG